MHQQSRWTATPSRLIGAPISAIPTIFMPDALPVEQKTKLWPLLAKKVANMSQSGVARFNWWWIMISDFLKYHLNSTKTKYFLHKRNIMTCRERISFGF